MPEPTEPSLEQKVLSLEEFVAPNPGTALQPVIPDLYEAYKIMRSYGVSNDSLFA